MNRDRLKNRLQGVLVTAPTPFDDNFNLDLARTTDVTKWWVENGLGTDEYGIKVAAAMGEGPDLSDDEWPHLLRTVVNAAGTDKNVLCALKVKNTLHTIEDAKKAQDLGAKGLQIDLPFMHHSNRDDLVRHFTDISDAIDIGIMIYNTHWFCLDPVSEYMNAETMLRLRDAERVVAIKWGVPDGEDWYQMKEFSHIFNVMDNSRMPIETHKNGGAGYMSRNISIYPQHDQNVWNLIKSKRYEEAQAEIDRVDTAFAKWYPKVSAVSGGYRKGKALMAAVGQPVGPPRPPTLPADENEIAEAKTIMQGLGWI